MHVMPGDGEAIETVAGDDPEQPRVPHEDLRQVRQVLPDFAAVGEIQVLFRPFFRRLTRPRSVDF